MEKDLSAYFSGGPSAGYKKHPPPLSKASGECFFFSAWGFSFGSQGFPPHAVPRKRSAAQRTPYPCGNSSLLSNLLATVWALSHTPFAQGVCSCPV